MLSTSAVSAVGDMELHHERAVQAHLPAIADLVYVSDLPSVRLDRSSLASSTWVYRSTSNGRRLGTGTTPPLAELHVRLRARSSPTIGGASPCLVDEPHGGSCRRQWCACSKQASPHAMCTHTHARTHARTFIFLCGPLYALICPWVHLPQLPYADSSARDCVSSAARAGWAGCNAGDRRSQQRQVRYPLRGGARC
jgi:hypothetical protein